MPPSNTSQPSSYQKIEQPITVEFLNDWWFLLLAVVAVVAYLVRLEIGVNANKEALKHVADTDLPLIRNNITQGKVEMDAKVLESRRLFSQEIQVALANQKDFISSQIALVLEKLNSRDNQMQGIKDQLDRQGQEVRELGGHVLYSEHQHKRGGRERGEED